MLTAPGQGLLLLVLVANGAAFLLVAEDKRRARAGGWRISEPALLLSAALGPFGAWAGMRIFRHKTRKIRFLVVPLFCLLQVLLILRFAGGFP